MFENQCLGRVYKESVTETAHIIGCDGLKATLGGFVVYERYVLGVSGVDSNQSFQDF